MARVEHCQDGSQSGHTLVFQRDDAVVWTQVTQVPRDRLLEESELRRARFALSRRTSWR